MNRTAALSALTLAFALAAPTQAQAPEPEAAPPPADVSDTVTVIGRPQDMSLRAYASDFVFEIGDPTSGNRGFARWGERVCVGVLNAPADLAQFVADRVSEIALEVGLTPGDNGCTPDLIVIFADDGAALASGLVEREPLLFRPFGGEGGTTQGLGALEDFKTSDAAVRWWQITVPVDWKGDIAIETPGQLTFGMAGPLNGPPIIAGPNSLILNGVEDQIGRAYVIVDTRKIVGFSLVQLADYIAMVSLAQIDPHGDAGGYSSILNVFESRSSVRGLTDWDWSYLRALYDLDRRLMPRNQRGALANLIARDQREDAAE